MRAILWGSTGQAIVVRPILEAAGHAFVALFDNDPAARSPFEDVPLLGGRDALDDLVGAEGFVVAIGGRRGEDRCAIARDLEARGLVPLNAVHSRAWVAASARLGGGCQVMALAAVSERAVLGRQTIVNTGAGVDHECVLGDGVHVMPGATLAGCVTVEDHATIGSNATVLPRLRVGRGAMVGAGAVVTRDVPPFATVAGSPARPLHSER